MDKRKLQKLKDIDREIKNLDAAARKLKNMAEEIELPIVFYNANRILGTVNVLKQNISEPLNIIYPD
ncbi:MAG: hypothetical protein GXZ07_01460 [Firmicutes bacterium]|nr:hypothetical protein [Bacillota bacterium]